MMLRTAFLWLALGALLSASSCDPDPLTISPEELAEQIRRNTPTELPPITSVGANTMGAWIETDTGRILFVASGVERPDPIGAESTDCPAFQNFRYESQDYVDILGMRCPRPEIEYLRSQALGFRTFDNGTIRLDYTYDPDGAGSLHSLTFRTKESSPITMEILEHDLETRRLSATFSATLFGWRNTTDSIRITDGRLDVTYGTTP